MCAIGAVWGSAALNAGGAEVPRLLHMVDSAETVCHGVSCDHIWEALPAVAVARE